jgi:hypothetical protein
MKKKTMITNKSILHRLPPNMDARQALFIDGIRHAGDIVSFAYTRLLQTLTEIAVCDNSIADVDTLYTSAFLDAWSIVDAIDRFRMLWKLLPNVTHSTSSVDIKSFDELSNSVRQLRNVTDHLAQRADFIVARKGNALGTLSWVTRLPPNGSEGVICAIVPGTVHSQHTPMVNPAGKYIEGPTGLVHLSAGEYTADLSAIIPEMALRVKQLEDGLAESLSRTSFSGKQAGADLLIKASFSFNASSSEHTS